MSAARRRAERRERLEQYAAVTPTGYAAEVLAAGPRIIEHRLDREVLWDAMASLRDIDLRWWRGQPEVVAAIKAARRAVLDADTIMAREIRRECGL